MVYTEGLREKGVGGWVTKSWSPLKQRVLCKPSSSSVKTNNTKTTNQSSPVTTKSRRMLPCVTGRCCFVVYKTLWSLRVQPFDDIDLRHTWVFYLCKNGGRVLQCTCSFFKYDTIPCLHNLKQTKSPIVVKLIIWSEI